MIDILDLAIKHETELQVKFADLGFEDAYKYYWNYSFRTKYKAKESTWDDHQFVSKDGNGLIGYLAYCIDRETHSANGLSIINFRNDANIIFAKDLHRFLRDIFEKFKFNKLNFSVVIGNPIEKSYDKMNEKYGGRVVGYKKNEVRLMDNTFCDLKMYEILREEYINAVSKK